MKTLPYLFLLLFVPAIVNAQPLKIVESDVCVYGGTSGGAVAAIQAARMGKSVVIAEPGRHLGGMTSGGLSAVDIGDPRSVGGIAREYFTTLAGTVGTQLTWDKAFKSEGGGPATGGAYAIEPHQAEKVFQDMLQAAGVKIHFNAKLAAVKKDKSRLVEIVCEDETLYRAKMFIDASYEGDLMAKAGVTYTLMREGNKQYGETFNGIQYDAKYQPRIAHLKPGPHGRVPGGQGVWDRDFPLDPYVVRGDPKSGLLPLIQAGEPGIPGDPAAGIQAYCFRLCLTTNPANSIPIAPPSDYDPQRYEIVARFIEACLAIGDDMDLRWFSKHDPLPNQKWDFNTATFGGNLPGASHAWPEASYEEREKIAKQHENYHRGLLHFLATDPRVPEKVRVEMQRFGLPKDEFVDNGGWPHQIYVREARRMLSKLVMTEQHTFGKQVAPKSIGLGSYGTDIHEIRRIVKDGVVIREGKIAAGRDGAPPYPIGYDAIVPRKEECDNLLVPFALSATHSAFASIRMEPVFMVTSQSAATAACLAMDHGVAIQDLDYSMLRVRLIGDRQVLEWKSDEEKLSRSSSLPVVDLSQDSQRHVVIAQGTPEVYQGHPTTLLLPDGNTMFCVWTLGHGGTCGPMKRSHDGGKTWSELLPVPENWKTVKNCPALYRLTDPKGISRLFVFAGQGPDGTMQQSVSNDDGKTWSPMQSNGLKCVMPFCTIMPVDGGKRLIGLTNIRRPQETKDKSNIVAQSESLDGGLTWSAFRVLLDLGDLKPCEPEVVRSPNGKQLLCLMRENVRTEPAHWMTSDDEGQTWSEAKPLPPGLHGDRHQAEYAPDGRLVICFRDTGRDSPVKDHFVAWVGHYDDILQGRDGEYKIKLLHSYKGSDCGYPGLELLPDGTFVATTYVKYRSGPELNSVVSTRFTLVETDNATKQSSITPPVAKPAYSGIVIDDADAQYTGDWIESTKLSSYVGRGYRHDNRQAQGHKHARFLAKMPSADTYEVRLLYTATTNRASNALVTITTGDATTNVLVNQRRECFENGVPLSLGRFHFEANQEVTVAISNTDADGYVVVDAVQWVPGSIADDERKGVRSAGFTAQSNATALASESLALKQKNAMASAVALSPMTEVVPGKLIAPPSSEPVLLADAVRPEEVHGRTFDLVVVGGTASGVACAVRAAREGCSVLLVQHNRHIGGMLSNGLMQWDALYGGPRAPLLTELLRNIESDAIARFGRDSKNHQIVRCTHEHYPISWVEPHVMERECHRLVAGEENLRLLLEHYPVAVQREGSLLKNITFQASGASQTISVAAAMFADATYEGDLMALAKVPYRVGREGREEYGEPHAGKVFTNIDGGSPKSVTTEGLNLRAYGSHQGSIDPTSPFSGDYASQAYNFRMCVTKDPANRMMLAEPPPGYNREEYVNYDRKSIATNAGPNLKSHMNSPILPGENHAYPEATWPEREKIIERHKNFALGLIWFLQNDTSVSDKQRLSFREWGLAKDEFSDNGHIPYEMYVREARRLIGRHVITEHDGRLAKGYARAPIQTDSIAVTDWYMDSHACTRDSRPGFKYDGKLILTEESRPMQVPYRAMLPQGVDNLLVPVCLSSTHVAWGALRLEPVWMQTGEAAGWAAALSRQHGTLPGLLDSERLLRTLVEKRHLVSFFNEIKVDDDHPRIAASQYFGTRGFFATYDAKLDQPLAENVAVLWRQAFEQLQRGDLDPRQLAASIYAAERNTSLATTDTRGDVLLAMWQRLCDTK